jgi:protein gp37
VGEATKIQWCHHTFNPWIGCQRVSPGCVHCYAEAYDKRVGGVPKSQQQDGVGAVLRWGPNAPRTRTSLSYWKQPLKWDREAQAAGVRKRVFCASLADVFEDRPELAPWREDLFGLIASTPHLDWLLLTKRPENIRRLHPEKHLLSYARTRWSNVWLGTTVEDQQRANERIPHLVAVPAAVRFLSCEPLLEPVNLDPLTCPNCFEHDAHFEDLPDQPGFCSQPWCGECDMEMGSPGWLDEISWVIVGGESGAGARPFSTDAANAIRQQCALAGVSFFMKQLGRLPETIGKAWLPLSDKHGGDVADFPPELRVREFPEVRHAP